MRTLTNAEYNKLKAENASLKAKITYLYKEVERIALCTVPQDRNPKE